MTSDSRDRESEFIKFELNPGTLIWCDRQAKLGMILNWPDHAGLTKRRANVMLNAPRIMIAWFINQRIISANWTKVSVYDYTWTLDGNPHGDWSKTSQDTWRGGHPASP
jgi:hypothetical protein